MAQGDVNVADADVQHWLQSVGVESLCQLEVLSFLHHHPITFLPPEYLARLLGYRMDPVVDALDSLSALQLLKWSAQSRGGHSYQFIVPSVPSRTDALERLLALSAHRSGRLLLRKHLGRGDGTLQKTLWGHSRPLRRDALQDILWFGELLGPSNRSTSARVPATAASISKESLR